MDTEKLRKSLMAAEDKARNLRNTLDSYESTKKAIEDIEYLQKNAGTMLFIGKSGRIGENSSLREVNINKISGCVEVPEMLIGLARKKLIDLEDELARLDI